MKTVLGIEEDKAFDDFRSKEKEFVKFLPLFCPECKEGISEKYKSMMDALKKYIKLVSPNKK